MPDIVGSIRRAAADPLTRLIHVDLGDGREWWHTRLYLVAALAEDYARIEALVFHANRGGERHCFVGTARPAAARLALAAVTPDLQVAYSAGQRAAAAARPRPMALHEADVADLVIDEFVRNLPRGEEAIKDRRHRAAAPQVAGHRPDHRQPALPRGSRRRDSSPRPAGDPRPSGAIRRADAGAAPRPGGRPRRAQGPAGAGRGDSARLTDRHPVLLLAWADLWGVMNARDFGVWVWFERLSWFVALAGFPLLLYQVRVLQQDQRRLADELSLRPEIAFGFLPDERLLSEILRRAGEPGRPQLPQEYGVAPQWPPGQNVSAPVSVTFVAVNVGARMARNVRFNLQFGSGDGAERKIAPTRDIHPRNVQPFTIDIPVPKGLTALPILTTASMDDTLPQQFSVTLEVHAAPSPAPAG